MPMLTIAPIAHIENQSTGERQSIENEALGAVSATAISFVSVASIVMCDPADSVEALFAASV